MSLKHDYDLYLDTSSNGRLAIFRDSPLLIMRTFFFSFFFLILAVFIYAGLTQNISNL